jgi:hypothetical protein
VANEEAADRPGSGADDRRSGRTHVVVVVAGPGASRSRIASKAGTRAASAGQTSFVEEAHSPASKSAAGSAAVGRPRAARRRRCRCLALRSGHRRPLGSTSQGQARQPPSRQAEAEDRSACAARPARGCRASAATPPASRSGGDDERAGRRCGVPSASSNGVVVGRRPARSPRPSRGGARRRAARAFRCEAATAANAWPSNQPSPLAPKAAGGEPVGGEPGEARRRAPHGSRWSTVSAPSRPPGAAWLAAERGGAGGRPGEDEVAALDGSPRSGRSRADGEEIAGVGGGSRRRRATTRTFSARRELLADASRPRGPSRRGRRSGRARPARTRPEKPGSAAR